MADPGMTKLTFFVELDAALLGRLVSHDDVIQALQRRRAALSVAMLDLSDERAAALRQLSAAGVPVTAWIVLEPAEGYWLGVDNATRAHVRYQQVRDWATSMGLTFAAVGLDIEMPRRDAVALTHHGLRALRRMVRRRRSRRVVWQAVEQYAQLLREVRADGFLVETYQLPLIVDERQAGATAVQRTLGLVDLVPDREVLMLYRSYLPRPVGETLVDAYGDDADGIAVGVTGGGVDDLLVDHGRRLDFDQLLTDLRRARRYTDQLYVFSLEGCLGAGYLDRLVDADLEQPTSRAPLSPLAPLARAALRTLLRTERLWIPRGPSSRSANPDPRAPGQRGGLSSVTRFPPVGIQARPPRRKP